MRPDHKLIKARHTAEERVSYGIFNFNQTDFPAHWTFDFRLLITLPTQMESTSAMAHLFTIQKTRTFSLANGRVLTSILAKFPCINNPTKHVLPVVNPNCWAGLNRKYTAIGGAGVRLTGNMYSAATPHSGSQFCRQGSHVVATTH